MNSYDDSMMKGRSLLTLADFTAEEVNYLLDLSIKIKKTMINKESFQPLLGHSMAMIFQKRSTRTRVSTETGITYMGGHALFLGSDDIQLGKNLFHRQHITSQRFHCLMFFEYIQRLF